MFLDATQAIERVQRWAVTYSRGIITDVEVVNAFLNIVMEAPLTATDDCLATLPVVIRPLLLESLTASAERDCYDHWVLNVRGWLDLGLDVAEQRQFHLQKQSHYRAVCQRLLKQLRGENAA